jgi:phospholipase/lecithinase/hemolysin
MTSGIRAALSELAEAHHTGWLDADALFWSASPDGLSANGLFWDDLHPSRQGHALLADALVPLVRPWVECQAPTCEDEMARGSADGS